MKDHLKRLSVILTAVLIITAVLYQNNNILANDTREDGVSFRSMTIVKDTFYSMNLSAGETHTFYFTPVASGLYTVESFGNTDVVGTVSGVTGGPISDDDSGTGFNFAIGFYQTAGTTTTITVRHRMTVGFGPYNIQVRNQKAQIYTFNYGSGDINTLPDSDSPSTDLFNIGYVSYVNENKSASHINVAPDGVFSRINSEVFFFSGHGGSGGGSVVFKNSSGYDWLYDYSVSFSEMENTKVAVWAACYSSLDPDGTGSRMSIAAKSIDNGAKSAIGWNTAIGVTASRKWTNAFFYELSQGSTVSAAASSAGKTFLWPWEGSYSGWQVLGNGNTVITTPNVNPKGYDDPVPDGMIMSNIEEFNDFVADSDYVVYELKGIGERYYRTINGVITNDFFDVYNSGNINRSVNSFSDSDICSLMGNSIPDASFSVQNEDDTVGPFRVESTDEHNVLLKRNNIIIPVKLIFLNYVNDDGAVFQDVECINLSDGTRIDYEDICTIDI